MKILKRITLVLLLLGAVGAAAGAADTVSTMTVRNAGGSWGGAYSFVFGNASDGTGEAAVSKVTLSGLQGAPTRVKIVKLKWHVVGMSVAILFDHTTDDRVLILNGDGEISEKDGDAPIADPASVGGTGNVLFTTIGHSAGDGYTISMEIKPAG
jgi:hypothetical protein